MKKTKKYTTLLLTFIVLCLSMSNVFNSLCLNVYKQFQLAFVSKTETKCTLSFTLQQWQKVKKYNTNEIEFNHKLFDIKKINITNNKVTLTGFYDEVEKELLEKIEKDIANKTKQNNNIPFFSFLYNSMNSNICIEYKNFITSKILNSTYLNNYMHCFYNKDIKPPCYNI